MEYQKPWLSLDDQIQKLVDRGLIIDDREAATDFLQQIGYYRLSGYLYPFRESETVAGSNGKNQRSLLSTYTPGTTLDQVIGLVDFDRRLRLLVLEAVE